jgi:uncharacterized protein
MDHLKEKIIPHMGDSGHGLDHVERVYNLAVRIAKQEKVDLDTVNAASLLHDIARRIESKTGKCHAEEGAKMAIPILKEINFPEDKLQNVIHCIKVHRYSKGLNAETKEAKILQDADRLDAIGAIATARILEVGISKGNILHDPTIKPREIYDGSTSTIINHFFEKILKIKPETFHTKLAKEIAGERYDLTEKFVKKFIKEWEGKA